MTTTTVTSASFIVRHDFGIAVAPAIHFLVVIDPDSYRMRWGFTGIASGDTIDEMLDEATAKKVPAPVIDEARRLCEMARQVMEPTTPTTGTTGE